METVKVAPKYQVVIPCVARQLLGLLTGQRPHAATNSMARQTRRYICGELSHWHGGFEMAAG